MQLYLISVWYKQTVSTAAAVMIQAAAQYVATVQGGTYGRWRCGRVVWFVYLLNVELYRFDFVFRQSAIYWFPYIRREMEKYSDDDPKYENA